MPTKGIERVKRNLKATIANIATDRTHAAIYAVLQQGSALSATLTPIDTGTLVNSLYKPVISGTSGQVGYTAQYAQWVHEMPGTLRGQPRGDFGSTRAGDAFGGGTGKGNYWDPKAVPHFLEVAFDQIKPYIPAILKEEYRV